MVFLSFWLDSRIIQASFSEGPWVSQWSSVVFCRLVGKEGVTAPYCRRGCNFVAKPRGPPQATKEVSSVELPPERWEQFFALPTTCVPLHAY